MTLPGPWDALDAAAWDDLPPDVLAAFDVAVPEWPAPAIPAEWLEVPAWDDAPVTDGDGLGDVSANMPSRTHNERGME